MFSYVLLPIMHTVVKRPARVYVYIKVSISAGKIPTRVQTLDYYNVVECFLGGVIFSY